jgi:hypothetical protein
MANVYNGKSTANFILMSELLHCFLHISTFQQSLYLQYRYFWLIFLNLKIKVYGPNMYCIEELYLLGHNVL